MVEDGERIVPEPWRPVPGVPERVHLDAIVGARASSATRSGPLIPTSSRRGRTRSRRARRLRKSSGGRRGGRRGDSRGWPSACRCRCEARVAARHRARERGRRVERELRATLISSTPAAAPRRAGAGSDDGGPPHGLRGRGCSRCPCRAAAAAPSASRWTRPIKNIFSTNSACPAARTVPSSRTRAGASLAMEAGSGARRRAPRWRGAVVAGDRRALLQ